MLNKIYFDRLLIGLVLVFLCSCVTEKKDVKSNHIIRVIKDRVETEILVCAHRSYHKKYPENSLVSVEHAISAGIDFVELDVRTTKDDSLVIMHDATINRTTNGIGNVKDYTYGELQGFNLKIGDSITKHKIPLLHEILTKVKGTSLILNLDLKAVESNHLLKELRKTGMEHQVISYTGSREKTEQILFEDPIYAVMPLIKTNENLQFFTDSIPTMLVHFTNETFVPENVRVTKKNGQISFINTLWKEDVDFAKEKYATMDSVISLNPSIIQTDHPKLLIEYLKTKGLHR